MSSQRAGLLVVGAAALHADGFRAGDLHVIHVAAIPQRLEDAVAEAEGQDVLDGFLAQVMIDAVDLGFVEDFVQAVAEFARTGEVVSEGLLDDQAPPAASLPQARGADTVRDRRILAGLRGEIEEHVAAGVALVFDLPELFGQVLVEARIADIAGHIVEPSREGCPDVVVELVSSLNCSTASRIFSRKCIVGKRGARDADDGESRGQPAVVGEAIERGQQFALGEVAIGAEDHDDALGNVPFEAERILERVLVGH